MERGECRAPRILEVQVRSGEQQITKKLAEQESDVESLDLKPCDCHKISAAAFAFLQVEVASRMETLSRGSKGQKMDDCHAFPWGRKMLKLT